MGRLRLRNLKIICHLSEDLYCDMYDELTKGNF